MERVVNFFQTILFLFIVLILVAIYFNGKNPMKYEPLTNTSEHKYIENRFKSEGYSKEASKAAADAIYKFEQNKKREW